MGNLLGAILPAIELSNVPGNDSFLFIADLHSLTTVKDSKTRRDNVRATAAAWLACGLDPEKTVFYRQSDLPEVAEFTWYLNCFTPFPMLANAHSFKDKSEKLADVNAGLFDYPVLMAADILMYDADVVPVGKDQRQHIEMTRDICGAVNHHLNDNVLVSPEASIAQHVMVVPGTDGQKMSKSYGNVIDVFLPEKKLKKQVMSIVTDSLALEDPKDPDTCNVVALYRLVASAEKVAEMEANYRNGGYGYGHAKTELLTTLLERFKAERQRFDQLMNNPQEIEKALQLGSKKAKVVAHVVLQRLRDRLGFGPESTPS